jgi:hypothetical protein
MCRSAADNKEVRDIGFLASLSHGKQLLMELLAMTLVICDYGVQDALSPTDAKAILTHFWEAHARRVAREAGYADLCQGFEERAERYSLLLREGVSEKTGVRMATLCFEQAGLSPRNERKLMRPWLVATHLLPITLMTVRNLLPADRSRRVPEEPRS